jgi:pimeloyl-ACP methyl ester carboxylesterase
MPTSLWRLIARLIASGLAALLCSAPGHAAEPAAPCTDPAAAAASGVPLRLPDLRYSCLALRSGQRMLVGQAGKPGTSTVLLVHGLGSNAHRDWAYVIPVLAREHHVIAIDLPGFASSQASPQGYSFEALGAALAEVLAQTAPDRRVHVVGHSLGGAVSLFFAHTHPQRVDRLVLVDAAGILFKPVFAQHIATMRTRQVGIGSVDRFLKGMDERINGLRRALFQGMDERFDLSRWLAQNPSVRYALLGRYTQVEAALGLVEHDFTAAIRETTAPTTVIWGRDDPIAPFRTGKLLAARMPDARLRVLDSVGHTPMFDAPEAFARLLQEALATPLSPRYAVEVPEASQGDVVCRNQPDQRYSGRFDSLTLENCANARIEGARIKQLTLKASSATLDDSVVESDDVALSAQGSELTATASQLRGRIAIRADDSRIDLAGVTLQATELGVEQLLPSRFYFSVSEWRAPDYTGDAHFFWPPGLGKR